MSTVNLFGYRMNRAFEIRAAVNRQKYFEQENPKPSKTKSRPKSEELYRPSCRRHVRRSEIEETQRMDSPSRPFSRAKNVRIKQRLHAGVLEIIKDKRTIKGVNYGRLLTA